MTRTKTLFIRSLTAALLAVATTGALVACGDDDDDDGGERETVSFELSQDGDKLTAEASESVKGGVVNVEFKNSSKLPSDGQLIRVDGDQSAEEVRKAIDAAGESKPIPPWLHAAGGAPTAEPGQTSSAVQELQPGSYYLFAAPESEGDEEGPPPALAAFEATPNGDAKLPKTDAKVVAKDYSFEATGLKAGKNEVEFDNQGKEPHHLVAAQLAPGKTIEDARKAFTQEGEPSGPPPVDEKTFVGTTVLDGGEKQVVDVDLKKGKYVLLCFISDRKGGPPHTVKGMVVEEEIK